MVENKLIKVLALLDRKAMTRFVEFSCSPYHNKHKGVQQLVLLFNDIHPQYTKHSCDRIRLFQRLFPQQPHEQARLALLFTYTFRLLQQFLQQETLARDSTTQQLLLLEQWRKLRMSVPYRKQVDKLHQLLEENPQRDSRYYFDHYRLAAEADRFFSDQGTHEEDTHIQEKQDQLDLYFIIEKLKDACEMTVRGKILKVSYQPQLLQAVLTEVRQGWNHYQNFPAVVVYFQLYELLTAGKPGSWKAMVQSVQGREHFFGLEERQLLYNYLQNYCIEQINQGRSDFLRKALSLYQYQLQKELLLVEGRLPEWHYKNIVTIGLRLKENDWVRQFLDNYRTYLPDPVMENAYTFNLASFYYQTGQLDQVLDLLSQVEYRDIRYSLGAKALLLRTYYDLEAYEALLALADSFRQLLQRNRSITDQRIQAFSNLLKLTRKAARLKMQQDYLPQGKWQRERKKLESELGRTELIINREWLERKIQELV